VGAGLLAVKRGFILFIKNDQFPLQINTLERESPILLIPVVIHPGGGREIVPVGRRTTTLHRGVVNYSDLHYF
jgi:hypothetical protein